MDVKHPPRSRYPPCPPGLYLTHGVSTRHHAATTTLNKPWSQVDDEIGKAKDGDIILMHDDEDTDIKTVALIASTLRRLDLCTGRIVPDSASHHIPLLDKSHSVKVVPW